MPVQYVPYLIKSIFVINNEMCTVHVTFSKHKVLNIKYDKIKLELQTNLCT
jgi:hypothetical protein